MGCYFFQKKEHMAIILTQQGQGKLYIHWQGPILAHHNILKLLQGKKFGWMWVIYSTKCEWFTLLSLCTFNWFWVFFGPGNNWLEQDHNHDDDNNVEICGCTATARFIKNILLQEKISYPCPPWNGLKLSVSINSYNVPVLCVLRIWCSAELFWKTYVCVFGCDVVKKMPHYM